MQKFKLSAIFILIVIAFSLIGGFLFSEYKNSFPKDVFNNIPTQTGKNLYMIQSHNLTTKVDPELVDLDSQIISCSPNVDSLFSSSKSIGGSCQGPETVVSGNIKGKFLGGQCCGALMDTKEYHKHLETLKKNYSDIPDIPLNPFKTPVELAKKWIDYDKQTTLNPEQKRVYDQAMSISKEGPCCCKCWHYYVNEGIGKKMIRDYGYSSKQVADFWDVSDICGS